MFGFGKATLDSQQFNNVYISCFVHLISDKGRFPSAADLQLRVASVLPQLKAKLTPEQERSITLIEHLMPSQKNALTELAKRVAVEMPSGDRTAFVSLADLFYRQAVLSDPDAAAFMRKYMK
jgi:hypothetical protein